MLSGDLDLLVVAHHSCISDWSWREEGEWQCMRHWSSSLEDSLHRGRPFRVGQWAKWGRRGRLAQS